MVTSVSHGSLTLNPNGGFSYTPTAGYVGPDSFTYQANDGTANSTRPPYPHRDGHQHRPGRANDS